MPKETRHFPPEGLRAIVLDFDGVVLESNQIKAEAFRHLFSEHPEHGDAIVKLHLTHGGMSRFEKFRIIYRDFLKRPLPDDEMERLNQAFGRLMDEQLMSCPFVAGAEEFLKSMAARYPLFIASGTPQEELREQMKRRGISRYFKDVYGSPRKKAQILKDLMAESGWAPREILFVGDAIDDYHGAMEAGVPFVARVPKCQSSAFPKEGVLLAVEDLAALTRHWNGLPKPG
jgi:HAD superfamily hydrolase (TIGR01549 family)